MTPRKPPNSSHGLFPDTWVVGTAAAALAKNDEGVLLADDPDRATPSEPASQPAPLTPVPVPVGPPVRSIEDELAELRAENERLRHVIACSRGDMDAVNWGGEDVVGGPDFGSFSDPRLYLDGEPHRLHGRAGRGNSGAGMRRALIAGMLVIVLGVFAAAWVAGQRLVTMEGPFTERIEMLGDDIAGAVGGLRGRALAWLSPRARPVADDQGSRAAVSGVPSQE